MSATNGISLANNVNASSDQNSVGWPGGRGCLVLEASSFPTNCFLQCLGPDEATWIDINATTFSANQATPFDLPAGEYRMHLNGGTTTALYASLVSVPYN